MNYKKKDLVKLFKDKDGRVVIAQSPNLPLIGWIVFEVASLIVSQGKVKIELQEVATSSLLIWAYLETIKGVNLFNY
jgi:hypothetical protein